MPNNVDAARNIIEHYYRNEERPFQVGYSGGKDSTLVLQLVCEVANKNEWKNPVFVGYNKTGLEPIGKFERLNKQLERMRKVGINAVCTEPVLKNRFWCMICGRGYPAPAPRLRYCTKCLKQQPNERYFTKVAKESPSRGCLVIDGTRKEESKQRTRRLTEQGAPFGLVRLRKQLNIESLSPIADVKTAEVWEYLESVGTFFWGGTIAELKGEYQNDYARDGCWVCPFLTKEKELRFRCNESQIKIRNFLFAINNDVAKRRIVSNPRQEARVKEGIALGRFVLEARKEIFNFIMSEQLRTGYIYIYPEEEEYIKLCWKHYDENPCFS